jgi:hypothetical protein
MVNGEAGKGDTYRPLPDFNKNYIKIFGKKKSKKLDQDIDTDEAEVQHEVKKDKSAGKKA